MWNLYTNQKSSFLSSNFNLIFLRSVGLGLIFIQIGSSSTFSDGRNELSPYPGYQWRPPPPVYLQHRGIVRRPHPVAMTNHQHHYSLLPKIHINKDAATRAISNAVKGVLNVPLSVTGVPLLLGFGLATYNSYKKERNKRPRRRFNGVKIKIVESEEEKEEASEEKSRIDLEQKQIKNHKVGLTKEILNIIGKSQLVAGHSFLLANVLAETYEDRIQGGGRKKDREKQNLNKTAKPKSSPAKQSMKASRNVKKGTLIDAP